VVAIVVVFFSFVVLEGEMKGEAEAIDLEQKRRRKKWQVPSTRKRRTLGTGWLWRKTPRSVTPRLMNWAE
jgi:hypothetical protein